jgi:hypothetical protein
MTRRTGSTVLIVIATLITFVAALTIWVSRQALETDQWTQTSGKLLEQPVIRSKLADYLTDQLYANVDVAGELRAALPARADALAGPAAGALRGAVGDVARKALSTPQAQDAWEAANRRAHIVLLKIINGGGNLVATNNGVVTLNVKALIDQLAARTGVGAKLAGLLPARAGQITILRSSQLSTVQSIAKALKPLAAVLVLAALALYAAAIAISRTRRRETLRAAGIGFLVAGIAALVTRKLLGDQVVTDLASTESIRPAVLATWTIGTSLLVDVAVATMLYGAVVVAGTWYAGPTRWAVAARRHADPHLRDWRVAYGGLAVVILLLLWWAPTQALHRLAPTVVLIALMAAGTEALRRQAIRETAPPAAPAPEVPVAPVTTPAGGA